MLEGADPPSAHSMSMPRLALEVLLDEHLVGAPDKDV